MTYTAASLRETVEPTAVSEEEEQEKEAMSPTRVSSKTNTATATKRVYVRLPDAATIRQWAWDHDIDCPAMGPVPEAVKARYRNVHRKMAKARAARQHFNGNGR